jgi:UDPglucose 6-dehydrogenase
MTESGGTSLRLSVIGTGYLGAVHAACMAQLGHQVIGLDTDEERIASLNRGVAPIYEPGLDELLQTTLATGRLKFTTDVKAVGQGADIHFICVGTPQKADSNAADLTYVWSAVDSLIPNLKTGDLVVGKSTVPVGTASEVSKRVAESGPKGVEVAWNPEFLREGFAITDTIDPDRLVIGVQSQSAESRLRTVYQSILAKGTPLVVTDFATAELVKVAANAFLATKISFINAMAEICEATGANVTELAQAIGQDPRIGSRFLRAGIGFGGGCLPKDIRAFMARADELGLGESLAFLSEIAAINQRRRDAAARYAVEMLGGATEGAVVAVLGAAFKPDSDDVRDSPALYVADKLRELGATVRVHDPRAQHNAKRNYPQLEYPPSIEETVVGADIVLHMTEWPEYRQMDPLGLANLVRQKRIFDGRNELDLKAWQQAGWATRSLGRPQ